MKRLRYRGPRLYQPQTELNIKLVVRRSNDGEKKKNFHLNDIQPPESGKKVGRSDCKTLRSMTDRAKRSRFLVSFYIGECFSADEGKLQGAFVDGEKEERAADKSCVSHPGARCHTPV